MKNRKFLSKMLSIIVALNLACSICFVQNVGGEEQTVYKEQENVDREETIQEVVEINTKDDFLAFAEKCSLDSWSANKRIVLKQNIDLTGADFEAIQVFTGIFDGQGHTISGFLHKGDGYVAGLFRYIEKNGLVENLRLKGEVIASDEKECIGGLCGVNYGTIQNCSFQGSVRGKTTVGGLVGVNEGTGVIRKCTVKGKITGYYSTGGLVGRNHGTLSSSINRAYVNNDNEWVEENDEMGAGLFLSLQMDESQTEIFSGVDAGGIAGYSDGMITGCTNYGEIGYEHTGYNIGGIVGRQSGVVSSSTNNGTVYGRKDIGGIVGQMEPYIEVDEAMSLRNAVDKLHDLIEKTIDDMENGKNAIKGDLDQLVVYSDGAVDASDALASQMTTFINDNMDQVQNITDRLGHVMDRMPDVFEDVFAAQDSFSNASNTMALAFENLKDVGNINGDYGNTNDNSLTLLSTVGGTIWSISHNPEPGSNVQIIVEPNHGYGLNTLRVIDSQGANIQVQKEEERKYMFAMSDSKVRVEAYFEYQGGDGVIVNQEDAVTNFFENQAQGGGSVSENKADSGLEEESSIEHRALRSNQETSLIPSGDALSYVKTVAGVETFISSTEFQADKAASERETKEVVIKLSSNLSGNAFWEIVGEEARLTVVPDIGYTVNGMPSVTADGQSVSVATSDNHHVYTFPVARGVYEVNILFKKVDQAQTVTGVKDDIYSMVMEQQAALEEVNALIQEIQSSSNVTEEQLQKLMHALERLQRASSALLSNLSAMSNRIGQQVLEKMKEMGSDMTTAVNHLKDAVNSIRSASRNVKSIVDYVNGQPDIRFSKLGADFDGNRENLHFQLKGMSNSIKNLSKDASNYSDVVNDDLRAVNDQINLIFHLLADNWIDSGEISVEELYEDVDIENIESITTGRTDHCMNKGMIKGDLNVGGIAGAMSIDKEDPEDSAAGKVDYQIGRRYFTKCMITGSVNEGHVSAKKDGAGGIVGYMKHGIVVDSEGYGSVESTEGDYVGGICGESLTVIKRCFALCSVSGGRNVGGIAGFADTLKECYAIVDCNAKIGRKGAIAGQTVNYGDALNEEEVKVKDNYYVGESLYGIDNISYTGVAEPMSYEELLTVENLPIPFRHLKVTFRVDDLYLGEQEVKFGESLSGLNYPKIPEKEGYYGVWPDYSHKYMEGNLLIRGEYKEEVKVVESKGRQKLEALGGREKPYALVEQRFTEDTVLNAALSNREPPQKAENKEYLIYDITLEKAKIQEEDTFAIRLLNPYENARVWGYKDGVWTELKSKERGQYLQVNMRGEKQSFCLIEQKSKTWILVGGAGISSMILMLGTTWIKKRKGKKERKNVK